MMRFRLLNMKISRFLPAYCLVFHCCVILKQKELFERGDA